MKKMLKKTALGLALGATAMAGVAPAAQARDSYGQRGGNGASAAVLGGLVGVAIGAAIGSGNRNRGHYNNGYNGYNNGYNGYYNGYNRLSKHQRKDIRYNRHGYPNGYNNGYNGYNNGYPNGYYNGYPNGYNGYNNGYHPQPRGH